MIYTQASRYFTLLAGVAALMLMNDAAVAAAPAPAAEDKPIISINGAALTTQDLATYARDLMASRGQQVSQQELLNTFVDRELLYQEALTKGIDKLPAVIRELDSQRKTLLGNMVINDLVSKSPVTEDDLRKAYQEIVVNRKITEYKARHILVGSEGEAKDIIAKLDKGETFSELAKSKSTDTDTSGKGGDLGWFVPTQILPELSQAVTSLTKGQYTKAPVKSKFGWHILSLENTRIMTPPALDDVKKRLEGAVQNQRVGEFLNDLRKKAKVEMKQ